MLGEVDTRLVVTQGEDLKREAPWVLSSYLLCPHIASDMDEF